MNRVIKSRLSPDRKRNQNLYVFLIKKRQIFVASFFVWL